MDEISNLRNIKKNKRYHYSNTGLLPNAEYGLIDVFKFICAILVVIIHIAPFTKELSDVNYFLQNCLCRIAVPFYFVSAGFFLYNKINMNRLDVTRIKNYCFKILRLLGTWIALIIVSGGTNQLWFLSRLVFAIVIISVIIYIKVPFCALVFLSVGLYLLCLLGDSYHWVLEFYFDSRLLNAVSSPTGYFLSFVFILMGIVFTYRRVVIRFSIAVVLFVISLSAFFAEVLILKKNYLINASEETMAYFTLLPVVFFMFYIATHIQLKPRMIYRRLRIVGMLVFYMHLFVYSCIKLAIPVFGRGITNQTVLFISTLVLTLFIAIVIERLSLTKRCNWLRYLYS